MYSRGQKAGECEHSPKYSKILYSLESFSGIEIAGLQCSYELKCILRKVFVR